MPKEVPLQVNMLTGELVDGRSRKQRQIEQAASAPQQGSMFSQREVAQFGVRAKPLIPLSPNTTLRLEMEDPRTEEEKEADAMREAERRTVMMPGFEEFREPVEPVEAVESLQTEQEPIAEDEGVVLWESTREGLTLLVAVEQLDASVVHPAVLSFIRQEMANLEKLLEALSTGSGSAQSDRPRLPA